jgi:hypothetical protein
LHNLCGMTLGQVVSNVLSAGLVAGWVGLRAYEMYQAYNRERPEDTESDDEVAFLQRQEQLQRRRQAASGPVIFTYSSSQGAQVISGDELMTGPSGNPFGIDLLNLQLGLVDRDFDESDYEMLLALDRDSAGRGAPVSEEQLSALPHHVYSRAGKQVTASESASPYHRALQERYGASSGGGGGGDGGSTATTSGAGRCASPAAAEEEAPTCSICLEQFDEGAQVSALPCFHTYHQDCVEPWLRQQGRASTCPICKTPVFGGTA